jgi:NifU-like protein involved in Fe-S cluster formation
MSAAQRLYTPELLALAVDLAKWPRLGDAPLHGDARSPTCGSTLTMDLELDAAGRIERIGMAVRACAVGQAAAAIFAGNAAGRDAGQIGQALTQLETWLAGGGSVPDWPGLAPIEPARAYSARHGAMLLPWKAALAALSSTACAG